MIKEIEIISAKPELSAEPSGEGLHQLIMQVDGGFFKLQVATYGHVAELRRQNPSDPTIDSILPVPEIVISNPNALKERLARMHEDSLKEYLRGLTPEEAKTLIESKH